MGHILDGINEYNTMLVLTKDKTKYPKTQHSFPYAALTQYTFIQI